MSSPKRARDAPARFEVVFSDTLRIFDKDGNNIEFKCVNTKTGLFSVSFNGRICVGNNNHCLDLYKQDGNCSEGSLLGFTLEKMLDNYANADKKRYYLGEALPHDELNAHFSFKGAGYISAISVRLVFVSPQKDHECCTLEAEIDMFWV
jgi:hypothetical protein